MKKRGYLLLFVLSLIFYFAVSLLQHTPGYMDASYYYTTGKLVANGQTTEPFLWNYLAEPDSAKLPIFSYWMPLAGLLAGLPIWISKVQTFAVARIPFILLAALIPVLCLIFARRFTQNRVIPWVAAAFGLLGGYYLPYLTIPETFTPFFVLGAVFFLLSFDLFEKRSDKKVWKWLLLGATAGFMHLCRADGVVWLGGAIMVCLFAFERKDWNARQFILWVGAILVGYLVVMAGWFVRNLVVYQAFFPSGSNFTLWMKEYNDLFSYPAAMLTLSTWLAQGWTAILSARLDALLTNLQTIVGIIGGIVLFPFLAVGFWNMRREKIVIITLVLFFVLFGMMSFIFPFAGSRGGFFHSASAFQVFFWAISAYGFEVSVRWIAEKRHWQVKKSIPLLGSTLVLVFTIVSGLSLTIKIIGLTDLSTGWDKPSENYQLVDSYLRQKTGDADSRVMVNDSPGFYAATGRVAIQEAKADLTTIAQMFSKYQVKYLLVGKDHLPTLDAFYTSKADQTNFKFIGTNGDYVIYEYLQ